MVGSHHGAKLLLSGNELRALPQAPESVALRELLAIYGEPDRMADGGMELRVPNEHLQIVCSQVATLTGGNIPRQPRAKREWLAEAAMTARAA